MKSSRWNKLFRSLSFRDIEEKVNYGGHFEIQDGGPGEIFRKILHFIRKCALSPFFCIEVPYYDTQCLVHVMDQFKTCESMIKGEGNTEFEVLLCYLE